MEDTLYDNIFTPLTVGDTVPEELEFDVYQAGETKRVSMKDRRGKWAILFFYPKDFTFVCPTELADMAAHYEAIQKEGGEVVAISGDTVFVHKAWHDASDTIRQIKFPMAEDPTREIMELFGVLIEDQGVAQRATFIVSPDGVIKAIEMTDDAIGRAAKDTVRKLKAAKYANEHPGNVCPATWEKEGDETLQPGMDLVGKI